MTNKRCGLCDLELPEGISWEEHVSSEQHQSHLPKPKIVNKVSYPVRPVSDEERQQNKKEQKTAKILDYLGYFPEHGKSFHRVVCECGEISNVYCWSGSKRCPNCWKVISLAMSRMVE